MTAEFLLETMQTRRQWSKIYKVDREKTCQSRILYPVKISFSVKEQWRIFGHINAPRIPLQQTATVRKVYRHPQAEGNDAGWKHGSKQRMEIKKALLGTATLATYISSVAAFQQWQRREAETDYRRQSPKQLLSSSSQMIFTDAILDKPILI